jgi:hypothetical protein
LDQVTLYGLDVSVPISVLLVALVDSKKDTLATDPDPLLAAVAFSVTFEPGVKIWPAVGLVSDTVGAG